MSQAEAPIKFGSTRIPQEVYDNISIFLDRQSLDSLNLVCRRIKHVFAVATWECVVFRGRAKAVSQSLDCFVRKARSAERSKISTALPFHQYIRRAKIYIMRQYLGTEDEDLDADLPSQIANALNKMRNLRVLELELAGLSRDQLMELRGRIQRGIRDIPSFEHLRTLVIHYSPNGPRDPKWYGASLHPLAVLCNRIRSLENFDCRQILPLSAYAYIAETHSKIKRFGLCYGTETTKDMEHYFGVISRSLPFLKCLRFTSEVETPTIIEVCLVPSYANASSTRPTRVKLADFFFFPFAKFSRGRR